MEVSEDAGEPNKDFNSTSENQQTNAPTPCQASLPAGDKAAGQPVPRRFPRVREPELSTLSSSLISFPSPGNLVFPWPGTHFLLNPHLCLIIPYHPLPYQRPCFLTLPSLQVQRTVLRRTRRRRRPRRRRRKPSRKILRTFARDGRKPSLEDGHPLNVEPSTSDPEQEGVTPSTSVSASD